MGKANEMYQCQVHYCGYVYDPEVGEPKLGIKPGTKFEDLPDDFKCPFCGTGKKQFRPLSGPGSVLWENIENNPAMAGKDVAEHVAKGDVQLTSPDAGSTSIT